MQQDLSPKRIRLIGIFLIASSALPIGFAVFFYFYLSSQTDPSGQSSSARLIIPSVLLVAALLDILAGTLFIRFSAGRKQEDTPKQEKIGPWLTK